MKYTLIFSLMLMLSAVPILAGEAPLPEGSFKKSSAEYYESGLIRKCKLKDPLTIQNMPCNHWVWFHENGRLSQFKLSDEKEIQGITVPAGSTVFLREDGTLEHCWFSRDIVIQGYPCNGGPGKISTAFHQNGKIACCFLAEPTEIQGVPCQAGVFKPVQFFESGNLMTCSLSDEYTSNDKTYKKGQQVTFNSSGRVVSSE